VAPTAAAADIRPQGAGDGRDCQDHQDSEHGRRAPRQHSQSQSITHNWLLGAKSESRGHLTSSHQSRRYAPICRTRATASSPGRRAGQGSPLIKNARRLSHQRHRSWSVSSHRESLSGLLAAGWRDRTALTGSGHVRSPLPGGKAGRTVRQAAGAGKPPGLRRVCGLLRPAGRGAGQNRRPVEARRLAYARQQGRRLGYMAGTRPRHGLAPAGVHHGRAAGSDPQPGASLRRPPAPLTAATTLSRFWLPGHGGLTCPEPVRAVLLYLALRTGTLASSDTARMLAGPRGRRPRPRHGQETRLSGAARGG
jgi:hypothetical protein